MEFSEQEKTRRVSRREWGIDWILNQAGWRTRKHLESGGREEGRGHRQVSFSRPLPVSHGSTSAAMLQNQKAFQLAANYLMQGRHRSRGYKYVIDVAADRGKLAREHTIPSLAVPTFDHLHLLVRRLEWDVGWGKGGNREPTNIDMMRDASATSNLEFIRRSYT